MTEFIEQSAKDIRYCLLDNPIDESQFTVIKENTGSWGEYSVTTKILGESHLITLKGEDDFLQEICACTDIVAHDTDVVHSGDLTEAPVPFSHLSRKLSYTFHSFYGKMSDHSKNIDELMRLKDDPNTPTAHHFFEADPNYEAIEPVTLVALTPEHNLTIRTLHTYPNEDTFVFTKSVITKIDIL